MMCYGMYSDVAYFMTIYYNIQTCFHCITKIPHVLNGSTIWHVPETVDLTELPIDQCSSQ